MKKHLFLLVLLSATYFSAFTQTLSQTKTATYLNNLNNFQDVYYNAYPKATADDVAADDNVFAYSKKLVADNNPPYHVTTAYSSLALQGFGFTIPEDAMIDSIAVKVRRFKKGRPSIKDFILSVMQSYSGGPTNGVSTYGVMWRRGDVYPGNDYPEIETEYRFSQSGSGDNGEYNHDQTYQWTPAMVNLPYFGVRIDTDPPEGQGSVTVYYDLVEITVQYSMPATSRKAPGATETKPLKQPIVYPNPFVTETNIQFTAAENGRAVVELYDINGAKIRILFSGNVAEGQVYSVPAGNAQLPKGIYVYMINNGKQKYTGRIIKQR